jgi:hypothetical protein
LDRLILEIKPLQLFETSENIGPKAQGCVPKYWSKGTGMCQNIGPKAQGCVPKDLSFQREGVTSFTPVDIRISFLWNSLVEQMFVITSKAVPLQA